MEKKNKVVSFVTTVFAVVAMIFGLAMIAGWRITEAMIAPTSN